MQRRTWDLSVGSHHTFSFHQSPFLTNLPHFSQTRREAGKSSAKAIQNTLWELQHQRMRKTNNRIFLSLPCADQSPVAPRGSGVGAGTEVSLTISSQRVMTGAETVVFLSFSTVRNTVIWIFSMVELGLSLDAQNTFQNEKTCAVWLKWTANWWWSVKGKGLLVKVSVAVSQLYDTVPGHSHSCSPHLCFHFLLFQKSGGVLLVPTCKPKLFLGYF